MNLKNALVKKLYKHPRVILGIILGITLFFALQLPRIRFDNNNFRFIPESDPARIADAEMAKIFGDSVPLLIGIQRRYSTIIDYKFLEKMQELDKQLLALPLVKSVVSLTTTTHIEAAGDSIVSGKLVPEHLTGSPEELNTITERLRSLDTYNRSLVSDDLKATQTIIFLNVKQEESGSPETIAVCRKVMSIAEEWDFPDSVAYVTGAPVFSEIVNEATSHDLMFLVPIVVIVVAGVLFFSFRRFTGVFLPLLTVIISCIWAIGAMALLQIPLTILSTVLPVILIAVGSAYGIHVINHYFDEVTQSKEISRETHSAQIVEAMSRVIPPVFLAALTTFAGFVSFCFTSVVPIFEFGIFSSFGVLSAFIVAVTLIPAILILRGPRNPTIGGRFGVQPSHTGIIDRIIADTLMIVHAHKRSVLLISLGCIIFAGLGISKLVIDNVLMEYFEPDVQVVRSDTFIRENFGGSKLLNLIIKGTKQGDVIRPDVLQAIDSLAVYAEENIPEVGKVTSLADVIKRFNQVYNADAPAAGLTPIGANSTEKGEKDTFGDFGDFGDDDTTTPLDKTANSAVTDTVVNTGVETQKERAYTFSEIIEKLAAAQAARHGRYVSATEVIDALKKDINYKGAAYYEIPTDPQKYGKETQEELSMLIQNYLLLMGGNVQDFIDDIHTPATLKVNIQLRTVGQHDSEQALQAIMAYVKANFPKDISVEANGSMFIEQSLNTLVVQSQLISVAVSFGIVFLILAIYYRSIIAGIIGIIPLMISVALNFGFMGIVGIKLNIGTAMVASFAIGIGIDYTIHYLAAYHHEYTKRRDDRNFLIHTFYGSGKAILFNAVSVGAGFAVLMLSKFNMLSELGLLIALVMATSSFASLTVLPTILSIVKPRFITKALPGDSTEP
ncbi:MAG: RND family transporter [Treponema sp.]|uniref:efflux RND transporter permease subunit n=1 Tax=Treponema sp. TaxID=166 RepID=UPI00360A2AD9